ncbi:hypothetical protein JY651_18480 [Pyxidicoccus parkwayensis]|uniref:DUF4239 domain-containing protein n=1 Tax=Pyxidicoccus parkwayensis TaxID=2813578 RepID=A0ABX7P8E9_9BACT|nr:hypothetical protein [Pyxidicoccus parkwaysis]QSQ26783.1 hypothetical protein JY651_18480 [Pyxidicoccus parkwaysis]
MRHWIIATGMVLGLELVLALLLFLAIEMAHRYALKKKLASSQLPSASVVSGVVFSLMGLVLAFSYSEAARHLEAHRQLVVDEANAITNVWFRIDVLPASEQPPLRGLLRQYLDERIQAHQMLPDVEEFEVHRARAAGLQRQFWAEMVKFTDKAPGKEVLLLPPVLLMADVASQRTLAVRTHISSPAFLFMLGLALVGASLVGVTTARGPSRNWPYRLVFVGVVSAAIHVVVDMEYPRTGIVSTATADSLLLELRETMR